MRESDWSSDVCSSDLNIEVIKEGQSKKTIIVGAHYDSAGTHGVDDNGSGVVVALESALRMIDVETPYTIKYVFFGAGWGWRGFCCCAERACA